MTLDSENTFKNELALFKMSYITGEVLNMGISEEQHL